jgi:hypothetical protein
MSTALASSKAIAKASTDLPSAGVSDIMVENGNLKIVFKWVNIRVFMLLMRE